MLFRSKGADFFFKQAGNNYVQRAKTIKKDLKNLPFKVRIFSNHVINAISVLEALDQRGF